MDNNKVNLFQYVLEHRDEEKMREVFLNMDIALKYLHEHGYCIKVFYPSEIEILNNSPEYIRFNSLMKMSGDSVQRENIIKEDIFNSSLIQIGLYTNTLNRLTPEALKVNFDSLVKFVPEGDIPYYRGVVQRNATVYFSEFALERMNRDLVQLDNEIRAADGDNSHSMNEAPHVNVKSLSNDKINDYIYSNISNSRQAAFVSGLVLPLIILMSVLILILVYFLVSIF